jgi:hypothetical protein
MILIGVIAAVLLADSASAQTVISGPNIMTSTWTPANSPYIIAADCTVPTGQTLTIQPGTTVWMGSGASLTGNGIIYAVGTAAEKITFAPPALSQMWNTIVINNTVGTNQFKYCEFYNATNALDFRLAGVNEVSYCSFSNTTFGIISREGGGANLNNSVNNIAFCNFQNTAYGIYMLAPNNSTPKMNVLSCTFSNCSTIGVYGYCYGYPNGGNSFMNFSIRNCSFSSVDTGCRFHVEGTFGTGAGNVQMVNNVFNGVTNNAIWFTSGNYAVSSPATLINNTILSAGSGVVAQDPWDAKVQSCLFVGCTSAVRRSGSSSATISYNDFHGNATNFVGYPVTYGQVLLANRNGAPCDVLFNIFENPMLLSTADFHLQAGSPCIDAGEGSGANFDSYFPPSMGSVTNDIGAYGGPNAGQWIAPPPTNTFSLAISKFTMSSVTINPPEPGNYRLEYSSALLGANTWIQITNLPLTTLPFTYTEPASQPARYYRAVKQ